jgi:lycopene cyclase domain-containing protein
MGHFTYLVMELVWALPVIALQWALGHRVLRARFRVLALGVLIPTLYLSTADALAIRVGIWTLNPERTLGIWIGGLPIEEAVFFFLTNTMVVQGLILALEPGMLASILRRGAVAVGGARRPAGVGDQEPTR